MTAQGSTLSRFITSFLILVFTACSGEQTSTSEFSQDRESEKKYFHARDVERFLSHNTRIEVERDYTDSALTKGFATALMADKGKLVKRLKVVSDKMFKGLPKENCFKIEVQGSKKGTKATCKYTRVFKLVFNDSYLRVGRYFKTNRHDSNNIGTEFTEEIRINIPNEGTIYSSKEFEPNRAMRRMVELTEALFEIQTPRFDQLVYEIPEGGLDVTDIALIMSDQDFVELIKFMKTKSITQLLSRHEKLTLIHYDMEFSSMVPERLLDVSKGNPKKILEDYLSEK